MKKDQQVEQAGRDEEPVGIVISSGWEPESQPRFSAYVWAPYPDDIAEIEAQGV